MLRDVKSQKSFVLTAIAAFCQNLVLKKTESGCFSEGVKKMAFVSIDHIFF